MADDYTKSVSNHKILRNTFSNYAGKFVSLTTWFILTPFILSHLGDTVYGVWVLVTSLVAYGTLFDLGISTAVTKYIAEYRARGEYQQEQGLVATALSLYTLLGLVVFAISVIIAPLFPRIFNIPPEQHSTAVLLVLLSGLNVGLSIPFSMAPAILRGLQRFDLINLIGIPGNLLYTASTIIVLYLGGGAIGLVATTLIVNIVMQMVQIWVIHRTAPELRYSWRGSSRKLIRTLVSYSYTIFLLNLNGYLETKTDEMVIGANLPVNIIAPYNIARRLSGLPQMLTDQFISLILPLASELDAGNDKVRLRSLYIVSTRLTLAIFLPVGAVLVILASPIIRLWVGSAYVGYSYLVLIFTLASLIDTSQWPAGLILQGMARHKLLATVSLSSGIANLVLSLVLVRTLGLTGVAFGTLIPTSIVCIGFVMPYTMRLLSVNLVEAARQILFPPAIPAIPMVIVMLILRGAFEQPSIFTIAIVAGAGLLVYALGYLSMNSNSFESEIFRNLATSTIRFAKVYLKSS